MRHSAVFGFPRELLVKVLIIFTGAAVALTERLPISCDDLLLHRPLSADGEYWMNVTQWDAVQVDVEYVKVKIYCHNMMTCSPIPFITLVAPQSDNYAYAEKERMQGTIGDAANTPGAGSLEYENFGETEYSKIRIKLDNGMQVDNIDQTFAQTLQGRRVPWGRAHSAYSNGADNNKGRFSINLAGTGLALHGLVSWIAWGYQASMQVNISDSRQGATAACGGFAGGCMESSAGIYLVTRPDDEPDESLAKAEWISADSDTRGGEFKVMDSAGDKEKRLVCISECLVAGDNCFSTEYDAVSERCVLNKCMDPMLKIKKTKHD